MFCVIPAADHSKCVMTVHPRPGEHPLVAEDPRKRIPEFIDARFRKMSEMEPSLS